MKRFIILGLMIASLGIFLPEANYATPENKTNELTTGNNLPQISIRIGQPRRRVYRRDGRSNRRWNQRQYRRPQIARYRVMPQYYWMNGRRYVRYVRVYY